MLLSPQKNADKKEGVGTYCFILVTGSRIAFAVDKTIAHTNGYAESHYGLH